MDIQDNLNLMRTKENAIFIIRLCFLNVFNEVNIPNLHDIEEKTRFVKLTDYDCNIVTQYNLSKCVNNVFNNEVEQYIEKFIEALYAVCSDILSKQKLVPYKLSFDIYFILLILFTMISIILNLIFLIKIKNKKYRICEG